MKRKVLLMGKSGSGKTSMRSIIFANYFAKDTSKLTATWLYDNTDVNFLGNLVLNLWDCGGQDRFMEKYFESQRDQIFRSVQLLVYVFDVSSTTFENDLYYFERCINALSENSKEAHIFCLIHKMDTVSVNDRLLTFSERVADITNLAKSSFQVTCFGTSIWDETLYKAWSAIVYSLIPNIAQVKQPLMKFCRLCQADEVVIFERATLLVISSIGQTYNNGNLTTLIPDAHRHEKISTVIKHFKLSTSKSQNQFRRFEVRTNEFCVYIDELTPTTFIMVITRDPRVLSASLRASIVAVRPIFEPFFPE